MRKKQQADREPPRRVLVAGMGNELRGDDSFGLVVVRTFMRDGALPPEGRAVELGIGGVGLVHELMAGYDVLILVDAIDRGDAPGTLYVLEPKVPEVAALAPMERRELAADMHQAVPTRALIMARALGVLPPVVRLVGAQPAETEEFSTELSPLLQEAVPDAVKAIDTLLHSANGHPS